MYKILAYTRCFDVALRGKATENIIKDIHPDVLDIKKVHICFQICVIEISDFRRQIVKKNHASPSKTLLKNELINKKQSEKKT